MEGFTKPDMRCFLSSSISKIKSTVSHPPSETSSGPYILVTYSQTEKSKTNSMNSVKVCHGV